MDLRRRGRPHMGTVASPWRYDAGAYRMLEAANARPSATWHYARGPQIYDVTVACAGGSLTIPGFCQVLVVDTARAQSATLSKCGHHRARSPKGVNRTALA